MSNEYQTNTLIFFFVFFCSVLFCFVFFFLCFFFFASKQQSRSNAILTQSNQKEPQTSNPKWSPQPKNPRSKPIGGTKGVTNLTGSFGMRAHHHHTKGDKSETNRDDRN